MLTARAVLTTAGVLAGRPVQSRRAVLTASDTVGAVPTARAVLTAAGADRVGVAAALY